MKAIITLISALAMVSGFAQDLAPALVFKRDRVVPTLGYTVWRDESLTFFDFTPSLDALVGYDPTPASEQMVVGYALVLNRRITESTSLFGGVAYLAPIGEVRFADLWDRLGVVAGARVRL